MRVCVRAYVCVHVYIYNNSHGHFTVQFNYFFLFPAIKCPTPELPLTATYEVTAMTYMSQVTYSCRPGYVMAGGDKVRTCEENGRWSGTAPTCESEWKETELSEERKNIQPYNRRTLLMTVSFDSIC